MPNRSFRRTVRRAYTMIELLTVIAIIGIISGILVVGFVYVARTSQKRQTVALLEKLNNATVEVTNSPEGAAKFFGIVLPSIYFPHPKNDFANSSYKTWTGVPVSALESQVNTGRVIARLSENPAAKASIDAVSTERRATLTYVVGAFTGDVPMMLDGWGNPIVFVFDNLQRPTSATASVPFTVNLGGTNNVIPGGATNMVSEVDKTYWEPVPAMSPSPTYVQMIPPGKKAMANPPEAYNRTTMTAAKYSAFTPRKDVSGNVETTFRSPDHRPFWMSAGPDGKYETHDDNVYSFGN